MSLATSTPISTVSKSRIKGDIILPPIIMIRVCWRSVKERVHLVEITVGGRIMLKRILKCVWLEVKWIGLSQD